MCVSIYALIMRRSYHAEALQASMSEGLAHSDVASYGALGHVLPLKFWKKT